MMRSLSVNFPPWILICTIKRNNHRLLKYRLETVISSVSQFVCLFTPSIALNCPALSPSIHLQLFIYPKLDCCIWSSSASKGKFLNEHSTGFINCPGRVKHQPPPLNSSIISDVLMLHRTRLEEELIDIIIIIPSRVCRSIRLRWIN